MEAFLFSKLIVGQIDIFNFRKQLQLLQLIG